jgi:hypothetical protein
MGHGQEDDRALAGVGGQDQCAALDDAHEVAVCEHHPLGQAGGAGGVDDGRDVIGADLGSARPQQGDVGWGRHKAGATLGGPDGQHTVQVGKFLHEGKHLAGLVTVLDDEQLDLGVGELVLHTVGQQARVDAHGDAAQAQNGLVKGTPGQRGLGQDRHGGALAHAELHKAGDDAADLGGR